MTQRAKPNAERPAAETHLHVVDLNRCQGYAQFCLLAPHGSWLHGEEALWYDPAPNEARREQVIRAATNYQITVNPDDNVGRAARVDSMEGRE